MTTNIAPDLRKAFILGVEQNADRLILRLGGVRRLGVLLGGEVVFTGAEVTGTNPRGSEPRLVAGGTIDAVRREPGETGLTVVYRSGPGEEDISTFAIRHGGVADILTPALGATLRRWVGFYPLPGDLGR